MSSSIIPILAAKLGITSEPAKKKAEELVRLVELKLKSSSLSSLNLSSTSIVIMCIDIAATACSLHVVKPTAVKLSGLTNKNYNSVIKILEQMLNMKQDISITNLSVQFGCSEAKQLAIKVLKSYQENQQNLDLNEMNIGLFNSASLFVSCRKLKLKVDKRKMLNYIGVQRSVFDRLVNQMDPIADTLMKTRDGMCDASGDYSKSLIQGIEQKSNESKTASNHEKAPSGTYDDAAEEPFYVWRERILKKAREALNEEKS